MFPLPMTVACLLLAANTGAPEPIYLNQNKFAIPIRIQPERRAEIRELLLYVSTDEGKTWQLGLRAKPEQEAFHYLAPKEGVYWFKVAILNTQGQQDPEDIRKAPAGPNLVIDSTKPNMKFGKVERQGEEVVVSWQIWEENPDPSTLRLEYRTPEHREGIWTPVPLEPKAEGDARFRPGTSSALTIRMAMGDMAKNQAEIVQELPANSLVSYNTASGNTPLMSPVDPKPPVVEPKPQVVAPVAPVPPVASPTSVVPQPALNPLPPPQAVPVPIRPETTVAVPQTPINTMPAVSRTGPIASSNEPLGNAISAAPTQPMQPTQPAVQQVTANSPTLLPVHFINKAQVTMDFEVTKCGPSGVGGVDVYQTMDDGRTWRKIEDNLVAVRLPMGNQGIGTGSVTVTLGAEGVAHGLFLVLKNRANKSTPLPQSGDRPHHRVEVDTTLPYAALSELQPETIMQNGTKRDAIRLVWTATDKNLAENPITLEWAERIEGPWQVIGNRELPNRGNFSWVLPTEVPANVYLRLTVRDKAGNNAIALTREPQLVDLREPEFRLIGSSRPQP